MPITSKTVSKAVYLSPTFWLYCCLAGSLAIFKPYPTSCPQNLSCHKFKMARGLTCITSLDGQGLDLRLLHS